MIPQNHLVPDTAAENCPSVPRAVLSAFGISYLYPWQRLVIENILDASGYSPAVKAEDTTYCGRRIVLLPTGAGKSLCFLIPALILPGPTLVIYPLLALMADQERRIRSSGLRSVTFRGNQSPEEREENFRQIRDGTKIILANPEVLQNSRLTSRLARCGIVHAAIDEAHCVSEWGDSFRPAYLALGDVIGRLNVPVVTAFTATASPAVLSRISTVLFKGEAHIIRSESDRPNIRYYVQYTCTKKQRMLMLARTERRPMIIFCGTRAGAEDAARTVALCYGRDCVRFYHAGLEKEEKHDIEQWFFGSSEGILCATCAYGMGVDKHDVRTVVHLDPPQTAEAYIQESGRAGRDGAPAKAVLLWSSTDSIRARSAARCGRADVMRNFAETDKCRRQVLLDALGAEQAVCSGCDVCDAQREQQGTKRRYTGRQEDAECFVLRFIRRYKKRYTLTELEAVLLPLLNRMYRRVCGKNIWDSESISGMLLQLEEAGYIRLCAWPWNNKVTAAEDRTLYEQGNGNGSRYSFTPFVQRFRLRQFLPHRFHLRRQERQEQA